ncbi:hypothetical protein IL306_009506 [Fusarium sp. DS 682]|nr:hypothetical protein IL306_009506 [Fusarium sp. DS 682]
MSSSAHQRYITMQRTRLQNEIARTIDKVKTEHRTAARIRNKRNNNWANIRAIEAEILEGQKTMFHPQANRDDQFKSLEDLEVKMKENHDEAYHCQDQLDEIYTRVVKLIHKQVELEAELEGLGGE